MNSIHPHSTFVARCLFPLTDFQHLLKYNWQRHFFNRLKLQLNNSVSVLFHRDPELMCGSQMRGIRLWPHRSSILFFHFTKLRLTFEWADLSKESSEKMRGSGRGTLRKRMEWKHKFYCTTWSPNSLAETHLIRVQNESILAVLGSCKNSTARVTVYSDENACKNHH